MELLFKMKSISLMKTLNPEQVEVIKSSQSLKWVKSVERNINLLCMSLRAEGMKTEYYNTALGGKILVSGHVNLANQIYDPIEVIERTREHLKKLAQTKGFSALFNIAKSCYETAEDLHNFLENMEGLPIKEKFSKFINLYLKLCPYLGIVRFSEKVLQDELIKLINSKVREQVKQTYYFEKLSFVRKEVDSTKEIKAFLCIVKEIKENSLDYNTPRVRKLVENHLKTFRHMKLRWNFEEPYTESEIEKRIKEHIKNNPNLELKKINHPYENAEKITKEFIENYNLTKQEIELIDIVKEFVYLRTFRTDAFFKSHYLIRKLLVKIADYLKISFSDLLYLQFNEILDLLNGKNLDVESLIKKRNDGWYLVMCNDKRTLFCGEEMQIVDDLNLFQEEIENKGEVRGNVASHGKIKGKVRIVKSVEDCQTIQNGEILVATMTFPQYIVALEKAAAFITDEGGVLCHAAIIAREMNKPCITGTQSATKILKTGDLIEVDADKGIVRKI
jgi:phosphohistidine swiveling domain-containing protein